MEIPFKVLARLRLGRDVAARVRSSMPNHRAWVYVFPLPDPEHGRLVQEPGREGRIVSINGNPIKGYLIRYLEVSERVMAAFEGDLLEDPDDPTIDQRLEVGTEQELAAALSTWITDVSELHEPESVGYWFDLGRDLVDRNTYRSWVGTVAAPLRDPPSVD